MTIDADRQRRRTFGAGIIEGFRLAGVSQPLSTYMNLKRYQLAEKKLTAQARKVFNAMEVGKAVTCSQVVSAIGAAGIRMDYSAVDGCLFSLSGDGLVAADGGSGHDRLWRRLPAPEASAATAEVAVPAATPKARQEAAASPAARPEPTALESLASLAAHLRGLADEIDDVALQVSDQMALVERDHAKLAQLKQMLKELA